MPILQYSEIRSAVLLVHGEKAHSRYFSETAYGKLTGDNKELLIIPGASHTDLYDQVDVIPLEKLKASFEEYLKSGAPWFNAKPPATILPATIAPSLQRTDARDAADDILVHIVDAPVECVQHLLLRVPERAFDLYRIQRMDRPEVALRQIERI